MRERYVRAPRGGKRVIGGLTWQGAGARRVVGKIPSAKHGAEASALSAALA
jgi:hypothetical protein